jgi:hexokinase
VVRFNENGKGEIQESTKAAMPGTSGTIGADAFFDEIAAMAAPLIKNASAVIDGIGFCFSYPMRITKDADGILLAFSKEVDAPDVIGASIGSSLKEALARQNVTFNDKIVLLNDTVATLLSGISELQSIDSRAANMGPLIGFILGTGFNTAYPEKRIRKINFECHDNPQIVVCETGNYAHKYMGLLDRDYDSTTKNPGTYSLEKATAGAYLGPLTFHAIKQALKDGIFSFARQDELLALPAMQTKDLNAFLHEPFAATNTLGALFSGGEKEAVKSAVYIASIITQRAALLAAAVLAAAVEKADSGFDPLAPAGIAVEGTTYLRYTGMRTALESYLHVLLNRHCPRAYIIRPVEQASLLGAAAAAALSGAH